MKRELPFLSPISIVITILFLAGLGYSLLKNGGLGFSPGSVSAQTRPGVTLQQFGSHADFEKDCKRCHQPLSTDQTDLCVGCHENIASQRTTGTSTHGSIDPVIRCADCHPEHKGRNYDPVAFAVSNFNHNLTYLSLTGAHAALDCESCHQNADYQLAYQGCSGCHDEPRMHLGVYSSNCEECHTDLNWKPAIIAGQTFDHNQTRFSLQRHSVQGTNQEFLCSECHAPAGGQADLQTCVICHSGLDAAYMEEHLQTMGSECLQCHDGTDRMAGFDHNALFPLDGQHAILDCSACHQDFIFPGTPTDCVGCHQDAEIHAGFFGVQCQYCHTSQAWVPAKLIQHTFLLDHGGQGEIACQNCHPDAYSDYTCYNCHDHTPEETAIQHQPADILDEKLLQCAGCHPTGQGGEAENQQPQEGAP